MRNNITKLVTALALAALSTTGHAYAQETDMPQTAPTYLPNTGQELADLIRTCKSDKCMSYVSGVIGGISIYAMIAEKPSPFCAGSAVRTSDIRDAIVNTIDATPALAKQHPAVGILAAFGRTWPCMTVQDMQDLQKSSPVPVDPGAVADLVASHRQILDLGSDSADGAHTIIVFHDPNVESSLRFRSEIKTLVSHGWHALVFPVALSGDDSAGYGAVELALRKTLPDTVRKLYGSDPDTADFTTAMDIATASSEIDANGVLKAVATSGAYADVVANGKALDDMGGKTSPAWIVDDHLYTGFLSAAAIRNIAGGGNAPSPEGKTSKQMEQ